MSLGIVGLDIYCRHKIAVVYAKDMNTRRVHGLVYKLQLYERHGSLCKMHALAKYSCIYLSQGYTDVVKQDVWG
jgi:hypothetical protein